MLRTREKLIRAWKYCMSRAQCINLIRFCAFLHAQVIGTPTSETATEAYIRQPFTSHPPPTNYILPPKRQLRNKPKGEQPPYQRIFGDIEEGEVCHPSPASARHTEQVEETKGSRADCCCCLGLVGFCVPVCKFKFNLIGNSLRKKTICKQTKHGTRCKEFAKY